MGYSAPDPLLENYCYSNDAVNFKKPGALPKRFTQAIRDSTTVLERARRGISIFESETF